ncbi:RagB/SusD family nutrient uptake outer membrane protein [Pedobacter sp. R-06]|uniref:RagB/SusD family nutrient uptake outer membrane protein n=1 Tax=Pedobacter sp. R-06 TaxID=3404051 RepID=UPI003CF4A14E
MKNICVIAILVVLSLIGCKKFLDEKSDKKLAVPENLDDLQALLNSENLVSLVDPSAGEISSDDFYLTDADFNSLSQDRERRLYLWQKDHLFANSSSPNDWQNLYSLVYLANTVIENIAKIEKTGQNATRYNNILGQAYFHRGRAYYSILHLWSVAYNSQTAGNDLGMVIRESTDFNIRSERSDVQTGYDYILSDLNRASALLPLLPPSPVRPAKQSALGLLSRVYLGMRKYDLSLLYADSCLRISNNLLDYNTVNSTKTVPFIRFNSEVLFDCYNGTPAILGNTRAKIVPELYNSYAADDLRKILYFRNNNNGTYGWRGSYTGSTGLFPGIAIDEILLNRAECLARKGEFQLALNDLNALLVKRYRTNTFSPYTLENAGDIKTLVLNERRKELTMRNIRWSDLKRLNMEGADINLKRSIAGVTYSLAANDPRYALEIPEDVVALGNITPNKR